MSSKEYFQVLKLIDDSLESNGFVSSGLLKLFEYTHKATTSSIDRDSAIKLANNVKVNNWLIQKGFNIST